MWGKQCIVQSDVKEGIQSNYSERLGAGAFDRGACTWGKEILISNYNHREAVYTDAYIDKFNNNTEKLCCTNNMQYKINLFLVLT